MLLDVVEEEKVKAVNILVLLMVVETWVDGFVNGNVCMMMMVI